jgi:predicted nucleic acid-binding protein
MHDFGMLVDSDAFVGLMLARDAHHQRAVTIFAQLKADNIRVVTTSFVVAETATVLSHISGQTLACTFLDEVIQQAGFPVIFVSEALHEEALARFRALPPRGMSVTDCANVAVIHRFKIPTIFSFDKVYRTQFAIPMAQCRP